MNAFKKQYEAIQASDSFRERIEHTMKQEKMRKGKILKSCAGAVACLMVLSVVGVNVLPGFADALAAVPGLEQVVRVITFGRYQNNEGGYQADIATPKIEGLLDKELEDKLNKEFKENANAIIAAYEQDVKELKAEFGDETVHMGIDSDYIVKTDNDKHLALDVYILYTAGSSSTRHAFYTIDKQSGTLLTLPGLFKEGADYVTPISAYIKGEMERRNQEEEGMFWLESDENAFESFHQIKPDQNFYINNDGNLVIAFDKYEVAAGAQGSPEFVIPHDVIAAILK